MSIPPIPRPIGQKIQSARESMVASINVEEGRALERAEALQVCSIYQDFYRLWRVNNTPYKLELTDKGILEIARHLEPSFDWQIEEGAEPIEEAKKIIHHTWKDSEYRYSRIVDFLMENTEKRLRQKNREKRNALGRRTFH